MSFTHGPALLGGMLIRLSAAMLLLLNGRVAGISGIVGRLAQGAQVPTNAAFVIGLVIGPLLYLVIFGHWAVVTMTTSTPLILVAGCWWVSAPAWARDAPAVMASSGWRVCRADRWQRSPAS